MRDVCVCVSVSVLCNVVGVLGRKVEQSSQGV